MAPISALWLFCLMLLMEGLEPLLLLLSPLTAEPSEPVTGCATVLLLLIFSGLNACLLNIANFLVTSYTSPVTLQVLGNVKSCLSIAVSVAIFRNSLTLEQAMGVATCLIGVWLYNQKDKARAVTTWSPARDLEKKLSGAPKPWLDSSDRKELEPTRR